MKRLAWALPLVALPLVVLGAAPAQQAAPGELAAGLILAVILELSLLAFFVVLAAFLPHFTRRVQDSLVQAPRKAFLIGLVNYIFLGAMGLVLANLGFPPLALIGLGLLMVLLAGTALGLTALASLTGERIYDLRGTPASPFARIVVGAIALELAAAVPVVGWWLLLPIFCLTSFGAVVLARFAPARAEVPEPEAP
ncbi:MAG: hypothetical protein ACE5MB_02205 [Anaerolineae bacterium]